MNIYNAGVAMGKKNASTKRVTSGAAGGPSTGRGIGYQVDVAVHFVLDLISKTLAMPTTASSIQMEPRVAGAADVTRWDVGVLPQGLFLEAKLKPARQELEEWLGNVRTAGEQDAAQSFELVYSTGTGTLLTAVGRLIRIAQEAGDDDTFRVLLGHEAVKDAEVVLAKLGPRAWHLLRRCSLKHMPQEILNVEVRNHARLLTGEAGSSSMLDHLFRTLHSGIATRTTFAVADLIGEIRGLAVQLSVPPEVHPANASAAAISALCALQACPWPLPIAVLAAALSMSPETLEADCAELVRNGVIIIPHDGLWSLRPLPSRLSNASEDSDLAAVLRELLHYIRAHHRDGLGARQLRNAVELVRRCASKHPQVVAPAFITLDKLLKALGDKHLVLEVADICIAAARRAPGNDEAVKGEVQALICGCSWVYQRVRRLGEAKVAAEKSLERGEDIGWDRNTAFCQKCIGRLCRMQAEESEDAAERQELLRESADRLRDAIDRFSKLQDPDLGPGSSQVGECYSLLARTYLREGRINEAEAAAREALPRLTNPADKDYLDFHILIGDLHAARAEPEAADAAYAEVIESALDCDTEKSEIRARAYLARGQSRARRGLGSAIADFRDAAQIWRDLDEADAAADAEWQTLQMTDLSRLLPKRLERERPTVRMAAVREYQANMASNARGRGRKRIAPPDEYWEHQIREAKAKVAREVKDW